MKLLFLKMFSTCGLTPLQTGWAWGLLGEDDSGQDFPTVQELLINRRTNWHVSFFFSHLRQFLGMRKEVNKKCWYLAFQSKAKEDEVERLPFFFSFLWWWAEKYCSRGSARLLLKKSCLDLFRFQIQGEKSWQFLSVRFLKWLSQQRSSSGFSSEILTKWPRLHSLHPLAVKPFKCYFKNSWVQVL